MHVVISAAYPCHLPVCNPRCRAAQDRAVRQEGGHVQFAVPHPDQPRGRQGTAPAWPMQQSASCIMGVQLMQGLVSAWQLGSLTQAEGSGGYARSRGGSVRGPWSEINTNTLCACVVRCAAVLLLLHRRHPALLPGLHSLGTTGQVRSDWELGEIRLGFTPMHGQWCAAAYRRLHHALHHARSATWPVRRVPICA